MYVGVGRICACHKDVGSRGHMYGLGSPLPTGLGLNSAHQAFTPFAVFWCTIAPVLPFILARLFSHMVGTSYSGTRETKWCCKEAVPHVQCAGSTAAAQSAGAT